MDCSARGAGAAAGAACGGVSAHARGRARAARDKRRAEAERFLAAGADSLCPPEQMLDMDKAAARLRLAVERGGGETVAVYGDYDVDGITSACLVTSWLRSRGLRCLPYIPDRLEEGYGLNTAAVDSLAAQGATLLITVDCGITAAGEAEHARDIGLDLIITDHHECSAAGLPQALAVVDPKRPGCPYPNKGLAGVGVAFKLLCAVEGGAEALLSEYADLVGAGTVADVMPPRGREPLYRPPRPRADGVAAAPRPRGPAGRMRRGK